MRSVHHVSGNVGTAVLRPRPTQAGSVSPVLLRSEMHVLFAYPSSCTTPPPNNSGIGDMKPNVVRPTLQLYAAVCSYTRLVHKFLFHTIVESEIRNLMSFDPPYHYIRVYHFYVRAPYKDGYTKHAIIRIDRKEDSVL